MKPDPHDYDHTRLATKLAEGWLVEPDSLVHVRGGANNVFRAHRKGDNIFVKVTAGSMRTENEVSGSSAFQRHLGDEGAPVSKLILKENGNRYGILEHNESTYYITVMEAARGLELDTSCDDPAAFAAWGASLARLHKAAENYDRTSFPYLTGDGEWERVLERCADAPDEIKDRVTEIDAWRQALLRPERGLPLTHGDMNAGNVIVHEGQATLIDFDEPMLTWEAADIARPFRETWAQNDKRRIENFLAFLNGYRSHREPEFSSVQDYENLMTLKNMEMYGWLTKVWKAETVFGVTVEDGLSQLSDMIVNPLKLE